MLEKVLNSLNKVLNFDKANISGIIFPALILNSQRRSGLSAIKSTQNILSVKKELGLPTGNFDDGTANYDDIMIKTIVEEVFRALQEDSKITVVIPAGTQIVASGGNAGGPIVVYGSTTTLTQGGAIIQ